MKTIRQILLTAIQPKYLPMSAKAFVTKRIRKQSGCHVHCEYRHTEEKAWYVIIDQHRQSEYGAGPTRDIAWENAAHYELLNNELTYE